MAPVLGRVASDLTEALPAQHTGLGFLLLGGGSLSSFCHFTLAPLLDRCGILQTRVLAQQQEVETPSLGWRDWVLLPPCSSVMLGKSLLLLSLGFLM